MSSGSLTSPSMSSPPASPAEPVTGRKSSPIDGESDLSELTGTEEDQETVNRRRSTSSRGRAHRRGIQTSRGSSRARGRRQKRRSFVPGEMWGWAAKVNDAEDTESNPGEEATPDAEANAQSNSIALDGDLAGEEAVAYDHNERFLDVPALDSGDAPSPSHVASPVAEKDHLDNAENDFRAQHSSDQEDDITGTEEHQTIPMQIKDEVEKPNGKISHDSVHQAEDKVPSPVASAISGIAKAISRPSSAASSSSRSSREGSFSGNVLDESSQFQTTAAVHDRLSLNIPDPTQITATKAFTGDITEPNPDVSGEDAEVDDAMGDDEIEVEVDLDLQPAHRAEALEVLATIELKFALLREQLYVEKMDGLAWEEALVNDGTHPELKHLQKELQKRKEKRIELASRRCALEVANISKRRRQDEEAIWSWWKLARDELQVEMIAETNRKRRKLERDRRAAERPQPVRRIPLHPSLDPTAFRSFQKISNGYLSSGQLTDSDDEYGEQLAYPKISPLSQSDVSRDLELVFLPRPYEALHAASVGPPQLSHQNGYDGMSDFNMGPPAAASGTSHSLLIPPASVQYPPPLYHSYSNGSPLAHGLTVGSGDGPILRPPANPLSRAPYGDHDSASSNPVLHHLGPSQAPGLAGSTTGIPGRVPVRWSPPPRSQKQVSGIGDWIPSSNSVTQPPEHGSEWPLAQRSTDIIYALDDESRPPERRDREFQDMERSRDIPSSSVTQSRLSSNVSHGTRLQSTSNGSSQHPPHRHNVHHHAPHLQPSVSSKSPTSSSPRPVREDSKIASYTEGTSIEGINSVSRPHWEVTGARYSPPMFTSQKPIGQESPRERDFDQLKATTTPG